MRNVKLVVKAQGIGKCIATVSADVRVEMGSEIYQRVSKDIDLGGNATPAALWGAQKVVDALNELEEA